MKVVISAATLLAMISAAQAQTPGFDAITTPAKDEAVSACADYTINWEYTDAYPGTVSIQLLQGATPTTLQLGPVLASGVDNSAGSYTWSVDCALGADATYGIKITYDSDATGATFQYSNPFSIAASTSEETTPTTAPATTYPTEAPVAQDDEVSSTLYSTAWVTVTSCAATVTDCPARSTVVSSSVYPVSSADAQGVPPPAGSSGYPAVPIVPAGTTLSTAAPIVTGAASPIYPTGNSTSPQGGAGGAAGTGGLPTTTGSGSAPTSSTVVTAGAGRVAGAGVAVVAGLVAAVFAL